MKKCIKWTIFGILVCLFIVLSILVFTKKDIYIDKYIYEIIAKYIKPARTNNIIIITQITSAVVVIIITLLVLIIFKKKIYGILMGSNLIIITIFQIVLKTIFARNRPIDINLINETGYSFPSGHSLTSMAFYGFIIYLVFNSSLNKKLKALYIIALIILIIMIGISRIYLGVHYTTDVIGGFAFSILYLILFTSFIEKKKWLDKK